MACFIELGAYNNNYKYIILAIIFSLLNNSLTIINYYSAFKGIRLFLTETQTEYSKHGLIHQIFNFFGVFIISIIFSKRNSYRASTIEEEPLILEDQNNSSSKEENNNKNHGILKLYYWLIIFVWILMEQVIDKYNCTLCHLDFWMIELVIITYLCSKKLHTQIYKHQKLVLYFNLIPIIFKIGTIIYAFKEKEYEQSWKIIYTIYPILIPIGILIYIPFMYMKSYANVSLKYFMDSKYFSANKILKLYGLIGTIFLTIICIISTLFKCTDDGEESIFLNSFCSIEYDNKTYFENFSAYIETETSTLEIIIEVLTTILGMIFFYFYKFYSMMIIKYLSPVYITFLTPVYYFLVKIIVIIYNLIFYERERFLKDESIIYIKENFFLDVSGDIFCLIGFLVYLEIF